MHADVVLKVLKLATDAAYTDFLEGKLVEWCAAAPKSGRHAPVHEHSDGEVSEAGKEGEGGAGSVSANGLINHCNLISKPKRTGRRREREAAAFDSNPGAFEQDQARF